MPASIRCRWFMVFVTRSEVNKNNSQSRLFTERRDPRRIGPFHSNGFTNDSFIYQKTNLGFWLCYWQIVPENNKYSCRIVKHANRDLNLINRFDELKQAVKVPFTGLHWDHLVNFLWATRKNGKMSLASCWRTQSG